MWAFLRYLRDAARIFALAVVLAGTSFVHDTTARTADLRLTGVGPAGASELAKLADHLWLVSHGVVELLRGPEKLWKTHDHEESDTPIVAAVAAPMSGRLILVRHADRDPNETDLNAIGRARAAALPGVLEDLPLDVIIIPDLRRNADTAAPLARQRGLTPRVRVPDASLAAALAEAADGRSAIWIGNVGNLSQLWDAYRLPGAPPVQYGEIAILTARNGTWQLQQRAFGP
jgi:hypothetical protein